MLVQIIEGEGHIHIPIESHRSPKKVDSFNFFGAFSKDVIIKI
jgi:hypothetical protein